MDKNKKYIHESDEEKNSETPPISNLNAKIQDAVQAFANTLYGEIIDENNALKKKNEELKASNKEKDETIVSQAVYINKLKKQLEHAHKIIDTVEECKATGDPRPMFKYEYDLSDFKNDAGIKDVDHLFDCLLRLAEAKLRPEVFLINNASDIVPIYIVLTKDSKLEDSIYQYRGKLTVFCDYWNTNIVPHIQDSERAEKLRCKYDSIKAEINKKHWKDIGPGSWRRLASESSKKKKTYQRAFNIKERIVNMITNKHRA